MQTLTTATGMLWKIINFFSNAEINSAWAIARSISSIALLNNECGQSSTLSCWYLSAIISKEKFYSLNICNLHQLLVVTTLQCIVNARHNLVAGESSGYMYQEFSQYWEMCRGCSEYSQSTSASVAHNGVPY